MEYKEQTKMTPDRTKRIEELFHVALKLTTEERNAYLAEACAKDPSLKDEVESLLAAYDDKPDLLRRLTETAPNQREGEERADSGGSEVEPGLPFERLGEFRLIRRLGEGGMGVVYLAEQESLGRQVALKVIRPERVGTLEAEARFGREIEAASELRHPSIVTVYGSGEEQGVRYFAMELVPGKGLDVLLREASSREEKIPVPKTLGWIKDIARALQCAHENGIIHRDVKPSNARITPEGRAILMDFGVARRTELSTLTLTGSFRGTPHYASPEQIKARKQKIDARTDVYSLGVALYEAITGRVPFEGETTEQVFRKILEEEPISPRQLNPSISRELETIVITAMEKNPDRRYQTMSAFAEDLERFLAGESISAKPAGWVHKTAKWIKRHRFSSFAAAVLLIVLGGLLILIAALSEQRQKDRLDIEARYKTIREWPEWSDYHIYAARHRCRLADPEDPGSYMLEAIQCIQLFISEDDVEHLKSAAKCLEKCIDKCMDREERILENDVHYLLGLIKLGLAEDSGTPPENRIALLAEGEAELGEAGNFDLASPEAFVRRNEDLSVRSAGWAKREIRNLKLNSGHYLVHLFLGASVFEERLYRGGKLKEYLETIDRFHKVLEARHDHAIASALLGRTYFFLARFYDYLEVTERAREYLEQAIKISENRGARPYNLIYTTLGQIALLRGEDEDALDHFNKAIALLEDKLDDSGYHPDIHNDYAGIGRVYARQDRFDDALEMYEKALLICKNDPHINVYKAELHLLLGENDKAFDFADKAITSSSREDRLASAYLVCARTQLMQEKYDKAVETLSKISKIAIPSPRHLSLACILLATFKEDWWSDENIEDRLLCARTLSVTASQNVQYYKEESDSPVCHSAEGVVRYLSGEFGSAVKCLENAMEVRRKWPKDVRERLWPEDARDLYFLAMAHSKRAGKMQDARECLHKADELFQNNRPYVKDADIIKRIHDKAHEVCAWD